MISFIKKMIEKLFYFPEIPTACPVCGQRNIVPSIRRYGNKDLLCIECEVVFSQEEPQDYEYLPQKKWELIKKSILQE